MEARVPPFRAAYAPADEELAARFLSSAPARPDAEARIDARAGALVAAIRAKSGGLRRHRGFPARVFALDQGGARPDGPRRGAAAGARQRDRGRTHRGQAVGRRLRGPRGAFVDPAGVRLGLGARHFGPGRCLARDAGGHSPWLGGPARPPGRAHRDTSGDAAHGLAFRARPDHRRGPGAGRGTPGIPLFLRHAGRGRAHRRRCRALFQSLCRRDCRDRRCGRGVEPAAAPGHLGETVGAPSALRGDLARPGGDGADPAGDRAGARRQIP